MLCGSHWSVEAWQALAWELHGLVLGMEYTLHEASSSLVLETPLFSCLISALDEWFFCLRLRA